MTSETPKTKGFFQNIKNFLGEKVSIQDGVFNEASFEYPQSQRNFRKAREVNDIVNRTAPAYHSVKNTKQNFDFGDEIEPKVFENDSVPRPNFMKKYEEKKELQSPQSKLPQPQILSQPIEGFDEIIVKRLINSNLQEEKEMVIRKKKEILTIEQGMFQIKKAPKKYHSFFEYITGEANRYILIENGHIYFLRNRAKNEYQVCSVNKLDFVFKIFAKSHQKKPLIKLAFLNDKLSVYLLPKVKSFSLLSSEQQNRFFIKIRTDLQRIGKDLQFMKK